MASWGGNAIFAAAALDVARSDGGEAIFSGPGCAGPWSKVATASGPVTIASAEVGASGVAGTGTAARAISSVTTPATTGPATTRPATTGPATTGPGTTGPGVRHSAPTPGATGSSNAAPVVPDSIAVSELQACLPGAGLRTYRGDLVAQPDGQTQDVLPLEAYLDGVVPAESPPSWMGSGGEAALQALAVAARSVAVALVATEGAICDTTQCQVYEGVPNEYGMTAESAVTSTSGQVLYCGSSSTCGPAGSIAVAEYSSSTGGYTAGGPFPPVPDLGDSVASNPVHAWTVRVPLSQVQSTFPSIGELQHVTVTKRNGLGQIGGRVEELELIGKQGSVSLTGNQFAADFDLYSDWFAVRAVPPVPVPASQAGTTTSTAPTSSTGGASSTSTTTAATSGTSGSPATRSRSSGTKPGAHPARSDGPRGLAIGSGYWVVNSEGAVAAFGVAPFYGTAAGTTLQGIVTAMAATPDDKGYWLAGSNGGVLAFGDASWYGFASKLRLANRVVGIVPAPGGRGYWLVARDGGIFAYGDAHFYGSVSKYRLKQPIVAIAATPDGHGYWLVSSDGGIFAFGDARFYGSAGDLKLNKPIVGIIASADGRGYSLIAKDGGVFAYGDARFVGSLPGDHIAAAVVGVSPAYKGRGYYVLTARGKVYAFGDGPAPRSPARAALHRAGRGRRHCWEPRASVGSGWDECRLASSGRVFA